MCTHVHIAHVYTCEHCQPTVLRDSRLPQATGQDWLMWPRESGLRSGSFHSKSCLLLQGQVFGGPCKKSENRFWAIYTFQTWLFRLVWFFVLERKTFPSICAVGTLQALRLWDSSASISYRLCLMEETPKAIFLLHLTIAKDWWLWAPVWGNSWHPSLSSCSHISKDPLFRWNWKLPVSQRFLMGQGNEKGNDFLYERLIGWRDVNMHKKEPGMRRHTCSKKQKVRPPPTQIPVVRHSKYSFKHWISVIYTFTEETVLLVSDYNCAASLTSPLWNPLIGGLAH